MNKKKRLSGLGIAGAIINILFAISVIIVAIAIYISYVQVSIFDGLYLRIDFNDFDEVFEAGLVTIIILLLLLFSILSVIKNACILRGKLEKKGAAITFAFLSGSILGAIFVAVSKVVAIVEKVKVKVIEKELDYQDLIEFLKNYKTLLDTGVITEEEFSHIKTKIINDFK